MSLGTEGFRWFIGGVEDVANDPLKLGRAKVRVYLLHDGVPTEELHWAHVMLPATSGSYKGIGDTPSLVEGTQVIGFFMDGKEEQRAMILGAFPIIPNMDEDNHSISHLARGKQILKKDQLGPEPKSAYKAEYPFNRVLRTRSGHTIELDDTPENERVHIYHKSGSYVEINKDGRIVIKSVDDSYSITGANQTVFVEGNTNVQVRGDLNAMVEGDVKIASKKNMDIAVGGTLAINAQNGVSIKSGSGIAMSGPGGVVLTEGSLSTMGSISSAVGVTGTFTSVTGQIVHVQKGIVTNIT